MDIHHLRVFVSVFKNRSFSRAAEELHLTQPTISDHMMALETELKCRLFDRLARKIVPTKEAETLNNQAIEIIEKMDNITDLLYQFNKEMTGHIVIGASTIPGTYILPEIVASFLKNHPAVLFEIPVSDSRDIIRRIEQNDLLIGVVGAKIGSGQVQYVPLMDDDLIVIAAPSFMNTRGITVKDLISLPIVMREEGSGTRKEIEKILEGRGISTDMLKVSAILGSTDAVKQAVKKGMGISILSRRAVLDEVKCKILKEIEIKGLPMKRTFYIVTHRKRTLPHQYKMFLEYLKTQIRRRIAEDKNEKPVG